MYISPENNVKTPTANLSSSLKSFIQFQLSSNYKLKIFSLFHTFKQSGENHFVLIKITGLTDSLFHYRGVLIKIGWAKIDSMKSAFYLFLPEIAVLLKLYFMGRWSIQMWFLRL